LSSLTNAKAVPTTGTLLPTKKRTLSPKEQLKDHPVPPTDYLISSGTLLSLLTVETVGHYLLQCLHYQHERHTLRRKLKRSANSLSFLLSDVSSSKPLIKYILATKRFENFNNIKK